jgi:hypothetical protein
VSTFSINLTVIVNSNSNIKASTVSFSSNYNGSKSYNREPCHVQMPPLKWQPCWRQRTLKQWPKEPQKRTSSQQSQHLVTYRPIMQMPKSAAMPTGAHVDLESHVNCQGSIRSGSIRSRFNSIEGQFDRGPMRIRVATYDCNKKLKNARPSCLASCTVGIPQCRSHAMVRCISLVVSTTGSVVSSSKANLYGKVLDIAHTWHLPWFLS